MLWTGGAGSVPDMPSIPTAPVVATGLVGGYLVARETGVRPLGGAVLGAAGLLAGRRWLRTTGPATTAVLSGVYLGGFGASHPLAKKIGAWPAVLTVAATSAAASWLVSPTGAPGDRVPAHRHRARLGPLPGFDGMLGTMIDELTPDRVVAHLDLGPRHHQPHGIVHGGVYCTLVEPVGSIAGSLNAPEGKIVVGVNNNTHFLASMSEGRVVATATPDLTGPHPAALERRRRPRDRRAPRRHRPAPAPGHRRPHLTAVAGATVPAAVRRDDRSGGDHHGARRRHGARYSVGCVNNGARALRSGRFPRLSSRGRQVERGASGG